VLIFFLVVQNVLDQIVAPQLHASSIGLHPLAVIFALLAGVQIGGVLGAIFALPVAGFLWIVCVALQPGLRTLLEPLGPAPTGPTRADVSPPQSAYAADQRQD
jgi:predicted PurR-regulated permease PerM